MIDYKEISPSKFYRVKADPRSELVAKIPTALYGNKACATVTTGYRLGDYTYFSVTAISWDSVNRKYITRVAFVRKSNIRASSYKPIKEFISSLPDSSTLLVFMAKE
jgi:hypothetical protein